MKHGKTTEEVWVAAKWRVWANDTSSRELRIENTYVQWLLACNRSSLLLCETSSAMEVVVVLHVEDDFSFYFDNCDYYFSRVKNLEKLLSPLEVGGGVCCTGMIATGRVGRSPGAVGQGGEQVYAQFNNGNRPKFQSTDPVAISADFSSCPQDNFLMEIVQRKRILN